MDALTTSWRGEALEAAPCTLCGDATSLTANTLDETGIYFGTNMGDLFYSNDAGETWDRLPGQLPRITFVRAWVRGAGDGA